ncbi:MAG: tetratricopeptide repeat protein, partial [Clostridia bacterium]|nr:tetratricopeptide repeat protein [Clostridia bacterium]
MSVFKCKMCGAALEVEDGKDIVKCDYCRTTQTLSPTNDDQLKNLYNRANALRLKCEFDKAEQMYEKIL